MCIRDSIYIKHPDTPQGFFFFKAIFLKLVNKHIRNAKCCSTGSQEKNSLFNERFARKPACRNDAGSSNTGSTLHVVIKSRNPVTIFLQDADGIFTRKVFPLNTDLWKHLIDRNNKGFNKIIKRCTANSFFL